MQQNFAPTVFVIDDDPAILKALQWLLASVGHPVETYSSAQQFLDQFSPDRAGCVVTDVRMPELTGLKLQEELQKRDSFIPVIVMTGHGDVLSAVRAMKAGAVDYIEKPVNDQVLLDLIDVAVKRDDETRRARHALDLAHTKYEKLTPREKEVTAFVANGKSSKEIARLLEISPKTVEAHRANIMEKVSANSIAELTKLHVVCA